MGTHGLWPVVANVLCVERGQELTLQARTPSFCGWAARQAAAPAADGSPVATCHHQRASLQNKTLFNHGFLRTLSNASFHSLVLGIMRCFNCIPAMLTIVLHSQLYESEVGCVSLKLCWAAFYLFAGPLA